jgi:hypothetical protein
MPSVKQIFDLSGGYNDVVEPELIKDNELSDAQNYEILNFGDITRRTEADVYDATLNSYIAGTLNLEVLLAISPPWYPSRKPSDMTNEFLLVVYGQTSASAYEMFLLYDTSGGWTHLTGATDLLEGLSDAGVDWDSDCDPEFSIGGNRMVVTDGVNRVYYIEIDDDGEVASGVMGIKAPTQPLTFNNFLIEARSANPGFTSEESESIGPPSLVHLVYTVVDEQGNESNPSPVSDTIDMQWNSLDTDFVRDKWIKRIQIYNLKLPSDISLSDRTRAKYFNVYARYMPYASDAYSSSFEFAQQFSISSKYGNHSFTLNGLGR